MGQISQEHLLQVTMDLVKAFYSKFIEWDLQLYDEETDTPARASKWVSTPIWPFFVLLNT